MGIVLPSEALDVTAKVDGQVEEIFVRVGDRVRAGTPLAVLDTLGVATSDVQMSEAQLQSAQSEVHQLEVELAQARERLSRAVILSTQTPLVSAEQLADVRYQEQLSAAKLAGAQSAVAERRALVARRSAQVKDTRVCAPFDGIVAVRYVDKGSSVARGSSILRLIGTRPLRLRIGVPSDQSQHFTVGCRIRAYVEDAGIEVEGVIEALAPEVDATSQMLVVEAVLHESSMRGDRRESLPGRIARVQPDRSCGNSRSLVASPDRLP